MWKQKHKLVLLIFSAHLNKLSHLWLGVCMHHVILAWIYNPNMKALFPSSIAMMILRSDLLRTFITVSVMARPLAKLSLLSMGLSIALIFWWEWGQLWVCTILFLIRNRYSAWIWSIFKLLKQIKLQHSPPPWIRLYLSNFKCLQLFGKLAISFYKPSTVALNSV